jgi:hypothetical protein
MNNPSYNSVFPGQILNPEHSQYDAGVLTTRQWRSVYVSKIVVLYFKNKISTNFRFIWEVLASHKEYPVRSSPTYYSDIMRALTVSTYTDHDLLAHFSLFIHCHQGNLYTVCAKTYSTEMKRRPVDTTVYSCEGPLHDRTFSNPEEMVRSPCPYSEIGRASCRERV